MGMPGPGIQPASRRMGMLALPGIWQALGVPQGNAIAAAGYRLGDRVTIPANTVNREVVWIGNIVTGLNRFKVILSVSLPSGSLLPTTVIAPDVSFSILGRTENDATTREVKVGLGNATIAYIPGRSLRILATNTSDYDLVVSYSLNEAEAGISEFTTTQRTVDLNAAPYVIRVNVPPFGKSFQVFAPSAATPNPTLNAYDEDANLVFSQVLDVPQSIPIAVVPGLKYILTPAAFPATFTIRHLCEG